MPVGNDLLLYESRKRAVERVKKMQDAMEKERPHFSDEGEIHKDLNEEKQNFQNNFFQNMNNNMGNGQNMRGQSSFLDGLFKGSGSLPFLKEQLKEVTSPLKGIMDYLDLDSEKIIIIMVMWVLFNEKSDKTLLLALGYLLL